MVQDTAQSEHGQVYWELTEGGGGAALEEGS